MLAPSQSGRSEGEMSWVSDLVRNDTKSQTLSGTSHPVLKSERARSVTNTALNDKAVENSVGYSTSTQGKATSSMADTKVCAPELPDASASTSDVRLSNPMSQTPGNATSPGNPSLHSFLEKNSQLKAEPTTQGTKASIPVTDDPSTTLSKGNIVHTGQPSSTAFDNKGLAHTHKITPVGPQCNTPKRSCPLPPKKRWSSPPPEVEEGNVSEEQLSISSRASKRGADEEKMTPPPKFTRVSEQVTPHRHGDLSKSPRLKGYSSGMESTSPYGDLPQVHYFAMTFVDIYLECTEHYDRLVTMCTI